MSSSTPASKPWLTDPSIAQRYAAAENATRPFASLMLTLSNDLAALHTPPLRIFDLGCGTGAVEAELYASLPLDQWGDVEILAGDVSPHMLSYLEQRASEAGWTGVKTSIVDGGKLDEGGVGEAYARIFVGFTIFMLPPGTVGKLASRLAPGGTLALSSWVKLPWYGILRRSVERVDGASVPGEKELWSSMTNGEAWGDEGFVRGQLEGAGLKGVSVVVRKERVDCGTPEVFMATFAMVLGLVSQSWPEEKRAEWLKELQEVMKGIVVEEVGGEDKHVFLEFEGIVGVGVKE